MVCEKMSFLLFQSCTKCFLPPFPFYFLLLVSYFFLLLQCIGGLHPVICLRISFATIPFSSLCFVSSLLVLLLRQSLSTIKTLSNQSNHPIHGFRSVFIFKQQQISSTNTTQYAQAHMQYQLLSLAMFTDCVSLLILTFFNTFPPTTPISLVVPFISTFPQYLFLSLFLPQFPFAVSPSPFSYIKKKPTFKVIIFLSVII